MFANDNDNDGDNNSFSIHDLDHAPEPPRVTTAFRNNLLMSPRQPPPNARHRMPHRLSSTGQMKMMRRFSAGNPSTTSTSTPVLYQQQQLHGSSSSARLSYDSAILALPRGAPLLPPERPKALRDRTWSAPVVTGRPQTQHQRTSVQSQQHHLASPLPPVRRRQRLSLQNNNNPNNNTTTTPNNTHNMTTITTPTMHNRSSVNMKEGHPTPQSSSIMLNRNRRAMSLPETDFQELQHDIHHPNNNDHGSTTSNTHANSHSQLPSSPPRSNTATRGPSYLAMPVFDHDNNTNNTSEQPPTTTTTHANNTTPPLILPDDSAVPNDDELHSPSFDYDYGADPSDSIASMEYGYNHDNNHQTKMNNNHDNHQTKIQNDHNNELTNNHNQHNDSSNFQPDQSIAYSDYLPDQQDDSAIFSDYQLSSPPQDNEAKTTTVVPPSPALLVPSAYSGDLSNPNNHTAERSGGEIIFDVDTPSDDLEDPFVFVDSDDNEDDDIHDNMRGVDEDGNIIMVDTDNHPRTTHSQLHNRARLNSNDSWAMEQQRQLFIQQQIDQLEHDHTHADMGEDEDDDDDSLDEYSDSDDDDRQATRRKTEPIYLWGMRLPSCFRHCRPSLHQISRCVVTKAPCFWVYYLDKTKRMSARQPTDRAILSRLNVLVGIFGIFQMGSSLFMGIVTGAPELVDRDIDTQTAEEDEAQESIIRVANIWHINTYIYLIGIAAGILVLSAVLTVRVVRNVNLVGAIRYLWVLLWILPFEIFFAIGLFDYFRVTDVFVRQYWRDPSMAWFRELFCEDAFPEICQPIFLPNGTVGGQPEADFCFSSPTANTLCTVPIGANFSQEVEWCLENYNSTQCTRIRNEAQEESTNWLLAFYYCNASWALAITAMLFLVVNTLEGIISKPLVQKSRESNVPAWMSLPILGCITFGFIFTFAQTSVLNTKSDTAINFIGPLYLVTAGLFFLASMLGWYLSKSSVLNTRHKRNKLISIWTFIILMTIILVALIALFASSLAFSSSIVDIGLSETRRSNLACIIDTAGSCTGCEEFAAGDPRRCPQWSTEDVTKVIQAQAKASATLSAIFMLYAFSAWRFGWGMKQHIRMYQIEYV